MTYFQALKTTLTFIFTFVFVLALGGLIVWGLIGLYHLVEPTSPYLAWLVEILTCLIIAGPVIAFCMWVTQD